MNDDFSIELEDLTKSYTEFTSGHKKKVQRLYSKLLKHDDVKFSTELISSMLQKTSSEVLDQQMVKYAASRKIPLAALSSFRTMLSIRSRREQISGKSADWQLNNKMCGYKFIDRLNVARPHILCEKTTIDKLIPEPFTVIKPINGAASRGVYLVKSNVEFVDVHLGENFSGVDNLKKKMHDDLKSKRVSKDSWQLEQLIADHCENSSTLTPATDLKFYCFYGEVGMILEADRSSGSKYCEWLPNGQPASTGRYKKNKYQGKGFTESELELAKSISLAIPSAFMRIDFLKTNQGIVFGEFTPRPGKYDQFSDEFDQYLGELYLKAESRLTNDLLHGKNFSVFHSVTQHKTKT